ncbi:hypothetical protein VNO78_28867 [Psophocarpus tetragonolobus]|uniref:PUM-HD domain-containing protein n=1 Tax=Psophocarpus tetragonolobus TaxID=3891 RepID=A0AAN9RTX3_PSOTE
MSDNMSSYGRRGGQGYSCFFECQSSNSFQQSPSSDHNKNPIHTNQTLEDAFARLSIIPTNHSFVGQRSGPIGAAKSFHFEGYGRGPYNFHSHIGPIGGYNGNENGILTSMQNFYCFDRARPQALNAGSHDALTSQKQRQKVLPKLSFFKDDLCFGIQRKSRGGVMSANDMGSSVSKFNVYDGGYCFLQKSLSQCCLYDLKGRILSLAKDSVGCRILQERMKNLTSREEVSFVFSELIGNVIQLMLDHSGNYVFQKLMEICNEEQRTNIILMVTKTDFQLVNICLDVHGTRAVQKLLEHVTTQEQRNLIILALCPGIVALTTDANGLHVIEHCLKYFSHDDYKYLLNIVANNCFAIATDRNGCCVMQHCVDHAQGETKEKLMNEIILNATLLADNCYGNYVVQHLVSLKIPRVIESLLRQLEKNFFSLSCNKYGSNVVERFFHDSREEHSTPIVLELLCNPNVSMLLVDPYGNYVIKSALSVLEGPLRNTLCDMVERHSPMMRNNLYGKKLLVWFDKWKLRAVIFAQILSLAWDARIRHWNYSRDWTIEDVEQAI